MVSSFPGCMSHSNDAPKHGTKLTRSMCRHDGLVSPLQWRWKADATVLFRYELLCAW